MHLRFRHLILVYVGFEVVVPVVMNSVFSNLAPRSSDSAFCLP
jgi:hypothetical protein